MFEFYELVTQLGSAYKTAGSTLVHVLEIFLTVYTRLGFLKVIAVLIVKNTYDPQ